MTGLRRHVRLLSATFRQQRRTSERQKQPAKDTPSATRVANVIKDQSDHLLRVRLTNLSSNIQLA